MPFYHSCCPLLLCCLPALYHSCPLPALPARPQDFKDQCEAYITLYGPLVFNMLITYLQVGAALLAQRCWLSTCTLSTCRGVMAAPAGEVSSSEAGCCEVLGCCWGADSCPPASLPLQPLPACLPACPPVQPDSLCTRIGYCPASTPLFIS